MQQTMPLNHRLRSLIAGALAASFMLAALGCSKKLEVVTPPPRLPGSTKIAMDDPTITIAAGKIEGPYIFIKSLSPTLVQIADVQGKQETVKLMGLDDEAYPAPKPKADPKAKETPKPEDPVARERLRNEMKAAKMEGIKNTIGTKQIYLIRVTHGNPNMVYMLAPDSTPLPGKPLSGQATIINAQAVRDGVANIDLKTPGASNDPLFDIMIDSQLAFLVEHKRKGASSQNADIWSKFQMQMPEGTYANRLAQLEKRM